MLKEKLKKLFGKSNEGIEVGGFKTVAEENEAQKEEQEEIETKKIEAKIRKEDELKKKEEAKHEKELEKAKKEDVPEEIEQKEEKKGFFASLKEKFTSSKITEEEFEEIFQKLELVLLENNVAYVVVEKLREKLKKELLETSVKSSEVEDKIKTALKNYISEILIEPFDLIEKIKSTQQKPYVIVFFGINGSGKTTTIARMAYLLKKAGLKCVISASDTFRAASIEQIEKHSKNLDIDLIKHRYGADPAAVAYDAIKHATAAGKEVVLVDTAGRMHNKSDLMREMEKIVKVTSPDLKVFVGESITGNDVVEQASAFNEAVGIDAVILTKADVDEKGGAMISVGQVTGKPIIYIGIGQEYKDLEKFDKNKIINSIFS